LFFFKSSVSYVNMYDNFVLILSLLILFYMLIKNIIYFFIKYLFTRIIFHLNKHISYCVDIKCAPNTEYDKIMISSFLSYMHQTHDRIYDILLSYLIIFLSNFLFIISCEPNGP
jgi:hypothetical protein